METRAEVTVGVSVSAERPVARDSNPPPDFGSQVRFLLFFGR